MERGFSILALLQDVPEQSRGEALNPIKEGGSQCRNPTLCQMAPMIVLDENAAMIRIIGTLT